ncbi:putative short chain type dehydrogenase [Ilyonectria destructans]|nr:putative short chain type dehydrogenase [Ilyonectria destructans]
MARLQSKVAIVTGSSSGIGRAIALQFHREGAVVICADLRERSVDEVSGEAEVTTVDLITKEGGTAEFVKVDVTKAADVENLVARATERFGRLDIMVNNAGVALESGNPQNIWDFPQDIWEKDLAINSTGVFLGCKYAAAQMIKQEPLACGDRGWILNTASVFGLVGSSMIVGYVASKHAVMGITRVAALDCAPYRIHVNAICPGYTETTFISSLQGQPEVKASVEKQHPFRGLGKAEDIAKAAVFLTSEENSWITGTGLPVDGGFTSM